MLVSNKLKNLSNNNLLEPNNLTLDTEVMRQEGYISTEALLRKDEPGSPIKLSGDPTPPIPASNINSKQDLFLDSDKTSSIQTI